MSRRLLLVPMHESTTATECGECPMAQWPECDGASWGSAVLCGAFGGVVSERSVEPPQPCPLTRLPECIAAEEAAQE